MEFQDSNDNALLPSEKYFWNNYKPKSDAIDRSTYNVYKCSEQKFVELGNVPNLQYNIVIKDSDYESWVPPINRGKTDARSELKIRKEMKKIAEKQSDEDTFWHEKSYLSDNGLKYTETTVLNKSCDANVDTCIFDEENKLNINKDWGRRIPMHDSLNLAEGDKIWNIINRGLFADIKLWINEYGNICCKAIGKVSVIGFSEKSVMEINSTEILRKFLNLSHMQWSSLCEMVKETKNSLNFSAFEEVDINKKTSLEKLWFFICKRRHFLPNLSALGKLCGAVKLMKEFSIVPKIIIIEVRDLEGNEII